MPLRNSPNALKKSRLSFVGQPGCRKLTQDGSFRMSKGNTLESLEIISAGASVGADVIGVDLSKPMPEGEPLIAPWEEKQPSSEGGAATATRPARTQLPSC